MMLNTDLHSPNIKPENKMTRDAFLSTTRGINDKKNLPKEFLLDIYESVLNNPFSISEDEDLK